MNVPPEIAYLLENGFAVIPACAPSQSSPNICTAQHVHADAKDVGKRPLTMNFPAFATGPLTPAALLAAFAGGAPKNYGIVIREGFVVIDTDSPEADAEFSALLPADFRTVVRQARPTRGRCWFFSVPPGVEVKATTRRGKSKAIDVLGAGKFFIVPPSRTGSGHVHAWAPGCAPWEVGIAPLPDNVRAQLAAWTNSAPLKKAKPQAAKPVFAPASPSSSHAVAAARKLVHGRSALRTLYEGKKNHGDTSASGVDFAFAREALKIKLRPDVVVELLRERPGVHRRDDVYLWKTVTNAAPVKGGH